MKEESKKYKFCNHHHELTEDQEIINLGTGEFVADKPMIPLLTELNKIGLITRSHCCGHESKNAFVVIKTGNITNIEIRNYNDLKEVVLSWKKN